MEIPPPIKKVEDILKDLNSEGKGIWVELELPFSLVTPKIEGKNVNFLDAVNGIVLKGFMNTNTAEIKIFVLKFTDDSKRNDLF
jgi:hypothetical protein